MAPVSASSSASARAARKGATQAPTKRSQVSTSIWRSARPRESVHGSHHHGQQQRAGQQRDDPTATGPPATSTVGQPAALVERGDGAQRGPAQRAEAILVDGLDGPVAGLGQLAASRDAHRVVAVRHQHSLGPDTDREGEPGQLAQQPTSAGLALQLLADRPLDRPLQFYARAARVVRPHLHEALVDGAETRHHDHGIHERGRS